VKKKTLRIITQTIGLLVLAYDHVGLGGSEKQRHSKVVPVLN
jgi:hypothetical protein